MKKHFWVWAAALLLVAGGGYAWYQSTRSQTAEVRYATEAAKKGTLETSVTASGSVVVDQVANVDPTIGGTVANLSVAVGDTVTAGQLLFTIVNDDLGVSAAQAAASLQKAENDLDSAVVAKRSAKADLDAARKKDKRDSSSYTSQQLNVLNDKVDIADVGITAAERSLAAAKENYRNQVTEAGKRRVTAPINGTVNAVNIKNGDDLTKTSSGTRETPMIIGDLGTIKAQVQVNEVDIPSVSLGQKAELTFSALEGITLEGTVEKIDALGTTTSGVVTYDVTIGFGTSDARIRPEMSVSARIVTGSKENALLVPTGAVKTKNDGSSYVEVLKNGTQTPVQVTVETGIANDTETEIVSGISAGDRVVTRTISSGTTTSTGASSSSSSRRGLGIPGL